MRTLWDLLEPVIRKVMPAPAGPVVVPPVERAGPAGVTPAPIQHQRGKARRARGGNGVRGGGGAGGDGDGDGDAGVGASAERGGGDAARAPKTSRATPSAQEKYDTIVSLMLSRYGVRVRRWRKSMSGMAWEVHYRDGTISRLLEAPRPRTPLSAAIFLHEIGHHAIGFNRFRPRCLEEYHAWAWSIAAMREHGLDVSERVRHRMHESLWYAASKARRRGIRELPAELTPYVERPPRWRERHAAGGASAWARAD